MAGKVQQSHEVVVVLCGHRLCHAHYRGRYRRIDNLLLFLPWNTRLEVTCATIVNMKIRLIVMEKRKQQKVPTTVLFLEPGNLVTPKRLPIRPF